MKKAKAQRRAKLPLVSPNWWTYGKTVRYVRTRMGDKVIADSDLVAAIERGDVRSKLEQAQMQYDPPARRSELLTHEFYQRDYKWVPHMGQWILQPRTDQRLLGRWAIYFWGPDIEKIWPSAAPTTTTQVREGQSKPGSADAWIDFLFPDDEWRLLTPKQIHDAIAKHAKDKGWKMFPSYSAVAAAVAKRSI